MNHHINLKKYLHCHKFEKKQTNIKIIKKCLGSCSVLCTTSTVFTPFVYFHCAGHFPMQKNVSVAIWKFLNFVTLTVTVRERLKFSFYSRTRTLKYPHLKLNPVSLKILFARPSYIADMTIYGNLNTYFDLIYAY